MTHATRIVAAVAVLTALVLLNVSCEVQTPEIDALRVRAEAGDAAAQYNLGVMYADGLGVPQDDAEAVRWFRLVADQGHAGAQRNLGLAYALSQGVPQDYAQAVSWYRKAALVSVASRATMSRNRWG
jgi:TPR repeat protein